MQSVPMTYLQHAPPGWDSVGPVAPTATPASPTLQDMMEDAAMSSLGLTPSPSKKLLSPSQLLGEDGTATDAAA